MNTHRIRPPALSLVPLLALACTDATGPESQGPPCRDDTGNVTVTVADGPTPTFSWSPACAMAIVLVEEDASDMWGASSDEALWSDAARANVITPPVTYGARPAGTTVFQSPLSLLSGHAYELVLWRSLPPGSPATCQARYGALCLMAVHPFSR